MDYNFFLFPNRFYLYLPLKFFCFIALPVNKADAMVALTGVFVLLFITDNDWKRSPSSAIE